MLISPGERAVGSSYGNDYDMRHMNHEVKHVICLRLSLDRMMRDKRITHFSLIIASCLSRRQIVNHFSAKWVMVYFVL